MAKKSKDPTTPTPTPTPKPDSNPDIFNKLFGQIPEEETSLFSSENPFKRKPTSPTPQIPPKKRPNEESSNLGDKPTSKIPSEGKKLKKEENPDCEIPKKVGPDEGNKKKRKRDELESEYEAKKYGGVVEEKVEVGRKRKASEKEREVVREEEGYDDEGKMLRTVFVGNLPLKVKKKVVLKEFSQFGEVESVRIRSVPTLDGKKPKKAQVLNGKINEAGDSVHAYIVFKTEQAAEASLAHNMSMVGGNHIRVDRACPPRKKLKGDNTPAAVYSSKRTVFVGNLPFDVKDEELYQLFCGIKDVESSVEAVRVIRDRATSLGKGIAYVLFKTREAANLVCKKRNLKIRDRELRICHAKSENQATPSKRKNESPDSEGTPAKKFSGSGKTAEGRYKVNTTGDTSYQGVRASKSDRAGKSGEKKRTPSRSFTPVASKSGPKNVEKVKQRSEKRPAVAARKAKALSVNSGGVSKQAGTKRKMDARTPQSYNNKKKFKKSK